MTVCELLELIEEKRKLYPVLDSYTVVSIGKYRDGGNITFKSDTIIKIDQISGTVIIAVP